PRKDPFSQKSRRDLQGRKFNQQLFVVMQKSLLCQQFFLCLHVIGIGNTTVYRTNGGTLRFVVEAFAFGTFIGNYIVVLITYRFLSVVGIHLFTVGQDHIPAKVGTIGIAPVIGTFIDGCVWTFRFAGTTVYTFVCYNNCHSLYLF